MRTRCSLVGILMERLLLDNTKVSDGGGQPALESVNGCRPPPFAQPKSYALSSGVSSGGEGLGFSRSRKKGNWATNRLAVAIIQLWAGVCRAGSGSLVR